MSILTECDADRAKRIFTQNGELKAIPTDRATKIMLEMLALKPSDKLLEIGTGSGTQTKEWAKHCKEVQTIELTPVKFADHLGNHVYYRIGDGINGIPEEAPYDGIVATCGVTDIPFRWKDQLAEGGRLVAPIGDSECQRVTLFMTKNGIFAPCRIGCYARFQMMQ